MIDLNNRRVEVRRRPVLDPTQTHGWAYADLIVFTTGDTIAPLAAPTAAVAVSDLIP